MIRKLFSLCLIMGLAMLMTACGQSGKLYLPNQENPAYEKTT